MEKRQPAGNSTDSKERIVSSRATNLRLPGLARLGFHSLRDLLNYKPVKAARILASAARGLIPTSQLSGLVKEEFVHKDATKSVSWPVTALRDVTDEESLILAGMGVKTIGDLNQLARESDPSVMGVLEDNGFRERPSAPAQLLPAMIGSTASSVRFTTFIRDTELRKLRFTVNKECVVPLPISPNLEYLLAWSKEKLKENKKLKINPNPESQDSLAEIFESQKCPVVHLGYMCDHRQQWINLGTYLGEVVHSLSLAPGESRNIAMVNWRRRQLTALEERTTTNERLTATFVQNRAIEEITSAVAREHQEGETETEANTSVTAASFVAAGAIVGGGAGALIGTLVEPGGGTLVGAAVGAGAGAVAGGLVYSGSKVLGNIEADTEGKREIVADVQQRISLSTSQTASTVRSLWSTVVVEDVQAESVEATTSNITNYNHMHALNIEYFEVLQHYLARIDVERVQPLLFLPFTFFDFTDFRFIRDYWEAVRPHIDDESLQAQGDSYFVTEEEPEAPDLLTVPPMPSPPGDPEPLSLRNLVIDVLFDGDMNVNLNLMRGNQEVHSESEGGVQERVRDGYDRGNRYTFGDEVDNAQEITGVSLTRNHALLEADMPYRIRVASGRLYRGDRQLANLEGEVIASDTIFPKNARPNRTTSWNPTADFDADSSLAVEEYEQARKDRAMIVAKNKARMAAYEALVQNIGRFRERLQRLILRRRHFFTRVILNAIEPEELTQLLEALKIGHTEADNSNSGIPLSDIAHTIPIGMTTGAFVLKLKRLDEQRLKTLGIEIGKGKGELLTLLQYADQTWSFFEDPKRKEAMTRADHIYVPTGGLFAEAILGRANSAEYLDMERYFNWQDSPIPHQAPGVQPVGTESRFQQGNVNVNVPEGNLQVINPVNLPEPTGLQGVLTAIQNPNLFRDMSKASEFASIIGNLTALAGQMGQAASTMTGQAAQQALQAATEVSKTAAGMAQSLMSEVLSQVGETPTNITKEGAALSKARELDQKNTSPGSSSSTGATPSGGASTSAADNLTSSIGVDIISKTGGVPARPRPSRNRDLNVRLIFLSPYGIFIVPSLLAGIPKEFRLIQGPDVRVVYDDTPGSIEAGFQQMDKLVDPIYTFTLSKWSLRNPTLIIELTFGEGLLLKGEVAMLDIPPESRSMVITAQIETKDVTVEVSASRTETFTKLLQNTFGGSVKAEKLVGVLELGFNGERTESDSNTDSITVTGKITSTFKIPTRGLDIEVKYGD